MSIAVLDDDVKYIKEYQKRIPSILEKNCIQGELIVASTTPSEFIESVKKKLVNLCIIDINLRSDINGMYIAKAIRNSGNSCSIIFMTGFLEYIREAFEVQAYNFIQKPGWSMLEKNLIKLNKEIYYSLSAKKNVIDVKCGSEVYFIPYNDIYYLQHEKSKTVIHCKSGDYSTYEGLEELKKRIDDQRFKQCHRSIYVNIDHVHMLNVKDKYLLLKDNSKCEIGPKYYSNFNNRKGWGEFLCL